jgi:hypothetical protein
LKIKSKRLWFGVGAFLAAGFIGLNALAYRQACAMMYFTAGNPRTGQAEQLTVGQKIKVLFSGANIPRPRTRLPPSALAPGTRSLMLDGANGIRLGAWYCPGPAEGPLVILFHGYSGEKSGTLPEAKAFLELGLSVLLVDFRGSGDSSKLLQRVPANGAWSRCPSLPRRMEANS